MGFIEKQGLRYFQFDIFKDHPIFHAILTRQGGCSSPPYESLNFGGTVGDDRLSVLRNHVRAYEILEFDFLSRFDVWQVHGTEIICGHSPRPPDSAHIKADGILTDKPEITLFMRFADCVPILLYDPVEKVIGIVHAGWQGTSQRIGQVAVEKMVSQYGTDPACLLAAIGPSICQACYEVGQEVLSSFQEHFGNQASQYFTQNEERLHLDLWRPNYDTLKTAGVTQIETAGICTACHLEDWYSHRAENGITGRFGVLMSLGG